jgi:putative transposase
MARRARVVWPGYFYHVTQRGNNRQYIFKEENDYISYLKWVEEYRKKYEAKIYAYCLMGNHVHFIIEPLLKDSLEKIFRAVHTRYAQYFNYKLKTSGHVWQGRFFSCALHGDHVRDAIRYVELNPVRAKMVDVAWQYPWSSSRAHLGTKYKWVTLENTKDLLGISSWKKFLLEGDSIDANHKLREFTKKNLALGPVSFITELEEKLKRKILPKANGRPITRVRP